MPNHPKNPFAVQTPENVSAEDVVSLFVDVFTDFYHIPNPGHTFLHGPRGSGKSMMFRYLEPDCQRLALGKPLSDLPFYAVYVPIKNTNINLTELARLEGKHAHVVFNEHLMTVVVAAKLVASVRKLALPDSNSQHATAFAEYYHLTLSPLLRAAGYIDDPPPLHSNSTFGDCVAAMETVFDRMHRSAIQYLRTLSFRTELMPYGGALVGFLDFLAPMLKDFRRLSFMPKDAPVFLLFDDADNLSEIQTRILNSWVATRTSAEISIKISTQLRYKTYRTVQENTIDAPHDFSSVNISTVYTSSKDKYRMRMKSIVGKRLQQYSIPAAPEKFFPADEKQERAINEIAERYKQQADADARGFRARDDATRYARPDYIKSLRGSRKQGPTYRYAGFDQLVHISSGVIRHFLDAASVMYAEQRSLGREVDFIDPAIQDKVVRAQASDFIYSEFDKIVEDQAKSKVETDRFRKLRNLILALGGAFHEILVSDASERRVFSIALSDRDEEDVVDILKLGVQYGYFHPSTIGNKEGTGRTRLFVLSRRLAPFFLLDPTSFAGYQFTTNEALRRAMANPDAFIGRIKSKRGMQAVFQDPQRRLPLEGTRDGE